MAHRRRSHLAEISSNIE